ncbi:MAG: aminodeoxychorismate synthase component I [Pseudomonadales bacterium]|nr:aminodeoxychorismate synthase component I [Pseudomonadales bacterium]|tara:strand:+ start:250 stop:1638 length:1389 start_codon:yes stop_codon:yes gene_type:complete
MLNVYIANLPFVENACHYFETIRHLSMPLLLDSSRPASHFGRYDIAMAEPLAVISHKDGVTKVEQNNTTKTTDVDPFSLIGQLQSQLLVDTSKLPQAQGIPFTGGAAGLFGFDLGRSIEVIPSTAAADIAMEDLCIGIYPWAIITDHELQSTYLVSQLDELSTQALKADILLATPTQDKEFVLERDFVSNMTREQYAEKFHRVIDYIHAGDCYQVCLAQRFDAPYKGNPWAAYKQLRLVSPTPFSAYMETPEGALLSLSPERFLKVDNCKVETKPIKGTRPRGKTDAEDQQLIEELAASPKDRSENVMIVDLLRNDISKHCLPFSVKVPSLFAIETYSNVHHLVTTVTGELESSEQILPLLKGAFPGGSITGAPKLRAMEIIEELEPHRRNGFTGSIGYISSNGRMDTNICIRTLVTNAKGDGGGHIYCWAGGGLIADSECDSEYQETFVKVDNLLNGLRAL